MKTIGLIGGMSWESSALYYQIINQTVRERLGGLHSAECLMYSFDFHEIEVLQHEARWAEAGLRLAQAAQNLERGGASCIVLCTNTMHKLTDHIEQAVDLPLLHIADATAERILHAGISRVGLLGTAFTMEQDFYKGRLAEKYGLDVIVPSPGGRRLVHEIIYQELCVGVIRDESREDYRRIMQAMIVQGAQAIILGCTEITLLVGQQDSAVPVFDTTRIHAESAVDFALAE